MFRVHTLADMRNSRVPWEGWGKKEVKKRKGRKGEGWRDERRVGRRDGRVGTDGGSLG